MKLHPVISKLWDAADKQTDGQALSSIYAFTLYSESVTAKTPSLLLRESHAPRSDLMRTVDLGGDYKNTKLSFLLICIRA